MGSKIDRVELEDQVLPAHTMKPTRTTTGPQSQTQAPTAGAVNMSTVTSTTRPAGIANQIGRG